MTEYAFWIRTRAGALTRKSFPIFWCYESLVPYVHEEALGGWPEQKVFGAIKEGPSVGMAPYNVQITGQEAAQESAGLHSYSSIY